MLLNTKADFIVSNPPYIAPEEIPTLQREVRDWEPHIALTDFADGLKFLSAIARRNSETISSPEGELIFEMGYDQSQRIKALVDRESGES